MNIFFPNIFYLYLRLTVDWTGQGRVEHQYLDQAQETLILSLVLGYRIAVPGSRIPSPGSRSTVRPGIVDQVLNLLHGPDPNLPAQQGKNSFIVPGLCFILDPD